MVAGTLSVPPAHESVGAEEEAHYEAPSPLRHRAFGGGSAPRGSTTVGLKALKSWSKLEGRAYFDEDDDIEEQRPKTRGECCDGPRPCPWVSCKYNLFLDVERTGSIKFNFRHLEPEEMVESCVLDIADKGGVILNDVGRAMNVTRERIRQLEAAAIRKLKRNPNLEAPEDTSPRELAPPSPGDLF